MVLGMILVEQQSVEALKSRMVCCDAQMVTTRRRRRCASSQISEGSFACADGPAPAAANKDAKK